MSSRALFAFGTCCRCSVLRTLGIGLLALLVALPSLAHDEERETLEGFLHDMEHAGDITQDQHRTIERLYWEVELHDELHAYLHAQAQAGRMTEDTAEYLGTMLHLEHGERKIATAQASFAGNGNVTLLGHIDADPPSPYYSDNSSTGQLYNGIWGYAVGAREYALHANSDGLLIIDVTNPGAPVRVQQILMAGGRVWRDVDTHEDLPSGKTYAYVGAQSSGNLFVVDLSYLSGTTAHGADSNPIPPAGYVDRGRTNWGHTVSVVDGLLFMNGANSNGCQIFDLLQDPWNPPLVASWSGTQRDCHDSYARNDLPGTGGKNVLFAADGYARRYRLIDISSVRSTGQTTQLGETASISGIYGHSNWITDDSKYLFGFEEFNVEDITVWDISNPSAPTYVTAFQWSGDASQNARVHNCQIRGDYLMCGYYEAGFRVFDISNPANPVETGMYETWRDPDGDGNFQESIVGAYDGAWNLHVFLPSGTVLVSDMKSGTFLFRVDPVAAPATPGSVGATGADSRVDVSWGAVAGATGYSVHRATSAGGTYTTLASNLVGTSYSDSAVANGSTYYYTVSATNAGGESADSTEVSASPVVPPPCGNGVCELGESCTTCAADCPSFAVGASCGNGVCEAGDGENCLNCAADCNGAQGGKPANRFCCGFGGENPVGCGDVSCLTGSYTCTETPVGGSSTTCCGDLVCQAPEDGFNCPLDCGAPPVCGDGTCDAGESLCSCAADCGAPPSGEGGLCSDGVDNDCDGTVDCADSDCAADAACQAVDCSSFSDKGACSAEASCRWSNKDRVCVAA